MKARIALAVVICAIVISCFGKQSSNKLPIADDAKLSSILSRMGKNRTLETREIAFADLMAYVSSQAKSTNDYANSSDSLGGFFAQHPERAEQVKLALIQLLTLEDEVFIQGKNIKSETLTEEDGEYFAEVIDTVASLDDERAIEPLVGAMTTGGMAQRGVLKYGDKALDPVMKQLKSSDALIRASALGMAIRILEEKKDTASQVLVIDLIKSSLKDATPVIRSQAIREISCLNERQDFVPVLQEISKNDTFLLPGRADDGGDGNKFYPVRYDARRVLRDIQNNSTCSL